MYGEIISKYLKEMGWQEHYFKETLVKYYRFRLETMQGFEYIYVNRSGSDAMLCLHPRFYEWRSKFKFISGVDIGGVKGGHILKSADMTEFVRGIGNTGNAIPEYFPLRFMTESALHNAVEEIFRLLGIRKWDAIVNMTAQKPAEPILIDPLADELTPSGSMLEEKTHEAEGPPAPPSHNLTACGPLATAVDFGELELDEYCLNTDEREALVKVRFGQGSFRDALVKLEGAKCWMSGVEGKRLLIASHIKPWSHCAEDAKSRGSLDNGLLLSALWDMAFDRGLISFDENWNVVTSSELSESAKIALNVSENSILSNNFRTEGRKIYLAYHRAEVFECWNNK